VTVSIREAGPADAPAVAGLLAELGYPSSEEEFHTRFERHSVVAGSHLIAAEEDGR
jgi:hypothetical protein